MSSRTIHNVPSEVDAEGAVVHVHGPSDTDISMTPAAALETAKRLGDAAVEAILDAAESGQQDAVSFPNP